MGLLNPGGPIAQFKRNRCSISPVELILQSGVRSRTAFLTADLHLMKENNYYTVTYGKHSKILLSVQSKQGEEMLFEAG